MLQARVENGILFLELNDPSSGNALSLEAARQIQKRIRKTGYRALIFSAQGRLFCSGGQLNDYAKMKTAAQGKKTNREIAAVLKALSELPVPTVALVTGDCYGGGVELLSAFDHVIATPEITLGFWQRKIGLSFGWGGGSRLTERVPLRVLRAWAIQGHNLSAYEALRYCLIDKICLHGEAQQEALRWVESVTSGAQAAIPALKCWTPKQERTLFEKLWWNKDHRMVLNKRLK